MHQNTEKIPTAILVAVDLGEYDVEVSLDELEELCSAAGATVLAKVVQKRQSMETGTCVGQGKLQEIADLCQAEDVDMVIFDCELTGSQMRNISSVTENQVLDRTTLILDIFAQRAKSSEGKLQVELAQYQYLLPRLSGMRAGLSRQGGGIGSRGPGETKLESDKRHIHDRVTNIKKQLKEMEYRRERSRSRRSKDGITSIAIVGYTNAGKSTLLNSLTDAGVLAKDMLFATLDLTSRGLELPDGRNVMLVDTIGLVRRLPHHLVEAFKSTLEEAAESDLILNICDITDPFVEEKKTVTEDVLKQLGAEDIPIITVYSKSDVADGVCVPNNSTTVCISSKTGDGLDQLLETIALNLEQTHKRLTILLPYDKVYLLNDIRKNGTVYSEEYQADGVCAAVFVDMKIIHTIENYTV